MSLHIQAPNKDPDYEEDEHDMGLFACSTMILETWNLW